MRLDVNQLARHLPLCVVQQRAFIQNTEFHGLPSFRLLASIHHSTCALYMYMPLYLCAYAIIILQYVASVTVYMYVSVSNMHVRYYVLMLR